VFEKFVTFSLQEVLLVVCGGILGSWLRFWIIDLSFRITSKKYIGTIFVNAISSFVLSLIVSFQYSGFSTIGSFNLFFVIGFLGSLSTFSTFMLEMMQSILNKKFRESIFLFLCVICIFSLASIIFQMQLS
tara:strand:+ start:115 stop:507 length:393 start_codon:yes stop_codon:yes gene_type:complete